MTFGPELKRWRAQRRLSQMDLALDADVSPRHVSFLETGRAQPSRDMIERLGQAMALPLEAINGLMQAAGFTATHPKTELSADRMASARYAVERIIARHDPFPGFAVDAEWRLIVLNDAARALMGPLGIAEGDFAIAPFLQPGLGATMVENWAEVGHHLATRLMAESRQAGGIASLDAAVSVLLADPDVADWTGGGTGDPVLSTRYRFGDRTLALFSTFISFQNAQDIALADLRIELLFPADQATAAFFGEDLVG